MTTIACVPAELIFKIFHLASINQRQSFRLNLCLIQRDWLDIAREVAFSETEITLHRAHSPLPSLRFAQYIKTLVLVEKYPAKNLKKNLEISEDLRELSKAAKIMSSLKISWSPIPYFLEPPSPNPLLQLFSNPNITHLALIGLNDVQINTIFVLFPSLQSLDLACQNINFKSSEGPPSPPPISNFRLKTWNFNLEQDPLSCNHLFSALKATIKSLSLGVNAYMMDWHKAALAIVGPNIRQLQLRVISDNFGKGHPQLRDLLESVHSKCHNIEQLFLDSEFISSFEKDLLLLPPSIIALTISNRGCCTSTNIPAYIVSALANAEWLPRLAEIHAAEHFLYGLGAKFHYSDWMRDRDRETDMMELCTRRGIQIFKEFE
jgi:hypothetical protein